MVAVRRERTAVPLEAEAEEDLGEISLIQRHSSYLFLSWEEGEAVAACLLAQVAPAWVEEEGPSGGMSGEGSRSPFYRARPVSGVSVRRLAKGWITA